MIYKVGFDKVHTEGVILSVDRDLSFENSYTNYTCYLKKFVLNHLTRDDIFTCKF